MIRLKHISLPPADRLALLLRAHEIAFEREFVFSPPRKWRADFVLPSKDAPRVLVEVEGGIWLQGGGRHQRGKGFSSDITKYEAARALGLQVVRCTPESIDDGAVLGWISTALGAGK